MKSEDERGRPGERVGILAEWERLVTGLERLSVHDAGGICMLRNPRTSGLLLIVAGALFLIAALMEHPTQPLRYLAGGLLLLAGVVHSLRGRRTP